MVNDAQLNARAVEIGHEIFEFAIAAQSNPWEKTYWLDRLMRWVDRDPMLRGRAFQFVDCLPALESPREIVRHLNEYLSPETVALPRAIRAALGDGWLHEWREKAIGKGAKFGARQMAGRFITGFDADSVARTLERLRTLGMAFTLDVLGEFTTSFAQADRYAKVYHGLIDHLSAKCLGWSTVPILDSDARGAIPRLNLSIKLTSLDPYFDAINPERSIEAVGRRLRPLLSHARKVGAYVNVDMESTKHRPMTLELFERVMMEEEFRDWPDVGIVVQAYLTDGDRDLQRLLEWGKQRGTRFAIRLVKGAYWDAETAAAVRSHKRSPAWTQKWESDAAYEGMARTMLEHADIIRPAFASHNVRSLAVVLALAEEQGIAKNEYEVQMLYGMGDPLKAALVKMGCCVRIYCPYGDLMPGMGYLIRRLLENTSNEGFLKHGFTDRAQHGRLLADPAQARPPSAVLPSRFYQNTNPEETMPLFVNASNTSFMSPEERFNMSGAINYVRGEQNRTYPLMIQGEAVVTGQWFEAINPSHPSESIGRVAQGTLTDVDRAVAASQRAFLSWRHTTASHRADLLRKAADRLNMRRFELAATMILEVGKPWREADADVTEAIDHCRYYAEQIERIESRPRIRNIPGENNLLMYMPKGVCAVLSPWSFPLAILSGMTTAALAGGNTVIMKPARRASVTAAKFAEVLADVGFPPGVVNFVPGLGAGLGRALCEHDGVHLVAFTGSHEVGREVLRAGSSFRAGQSFIRKLIVEMGGKNAIIVDDDADLDGAVQGVMESAFAFAGQKCSSCSRLIVVDSVYESLKSRLSEAVASLPIGPAEVPGVIVGPVIDAEARERIEKFIKIGRGEGRMLVQADLPPECGDGFFVPPTVFVEVNRNARIAQEEILGPVLAVARARDFDEALEIANATRYALTGGIYSRSPAHMDRAKREFQVGNLYINRKITGSQVDSQPFGGFKLSGTGVKAGSPDYLLHFMDARCITENTLRSGFVPNEEQARTRD